MEFQRRIFRILESTAYNVKMLTREVQHVKQLLLTRNISVNSSLNADDQSIADPSVCDFNLPVSSTDELDQLNQRITEDTVFRSLVSI